MKSNLDVLAGWAAARELREAYGNPHPLSLDLEQLLYDEGTVVRRVPSLGARARLSRMLGRAIVSVGPLLSVEELRFTLAHELLHRRAHRHLSSHQLCGGGEREEVEDGREAEANGFAAWWLMPLERVEPLFSRGAPTWSVVLEVADEFVVSPPAAAIRAAELTSAAFAVVYARDGKISWIKKSPGFVGWIKRRSDDALPSSSPARAFFDGGSCPDGPIEIPASTWIARPPTELRVWEHAIASPEHGSVISLITFR
jgi:IrrE N-terminal-like domain